ncbi:MAG: radical SAM protein [Candidatus Njordarchaeum guaymaensis]
MNDSYPEVLQIEPTNDCNLNCIMCIRRFWNEKVGYMDLKTYEKIAHESFNKLKKVVLYGFGEPLVHPKFIDMVAIARKFLPDTGKILFSTNGSLLTARKADKLIKEIGVDEISFSIDSTDFTELERIRKGAEAKKIFENLRYVLNSKKKAKRMLQVAIEIVIMKKNLKELPKLIEKAAEMGIDKILVSHLIPFSRHISDEILYTTVSKDSFKISKDVLDSGEDFFRNVFYEVAFRTYGQIVPLKNYSRYREIWQNALNLGLEINPELLLNTRERYSLIKATEEIFSLSRKKAKEYDVKLELPAIFVDPRKRKCPYVENNAMVIRWNGDVTPCQNFMYSHKVFVNNHIRTVNAIILGNIKKKTISEIWNSQTYVQLRKRLSNFNRENPWCGDCPFVALNCYFTRSNQKDCYNNEPSCAECLYSVDIAKCLL